MQPSPRRLRVRTGAFGSSLEAAINALGDGAHLIILDNCEHLIERASEIAEAILMLLEKEKTVAEGAGAAPLAALIHRRIPAVLGKKVAVVVGGGNIDVNVISRIIDRGLVKSGRVVRGRAWTGAPHGGCRGSSKEWSWSR